MDAKCACQLTTVSVVYIYVASLRSSHVASALASSTATGGGSGGTGGSGGGSGAAGGAFGSTSLTPNALLSYTTNIMSSATGGGTGNYMSSKGAAGGPSYEEGNSAVRFGENGAQDKKTMLLFVVGGLSYIEIAAFRFLSNDPSFPYRILLATTKLVNGSTLISSLKHTF